MPRHLLFVFGSQGCIPERGLLAARDLGLDITVFGEKLGCCMSESMFDRLERVSLEKPEPALAAARRLHAYHPIDGVMAYDDQGVPVAARICAELGLPGQPVAAAEASRDKARMKQRFAAGGVPIAPYLLADGEDDAVSWAEANGYPVVVKPTRGAGSQGVIRADDEDALRQAYRRTRRIVRDYGIDTGGRPERQLLVERYIEGAEFSVELVIRDGEPHVLCVFEKPRALTGPYFEESIYITPTRLGERREAEIGEVAKQSVRALGLGCGAAHCEIRRGEHGSVVLETGARLIGGACSRVFDHVLEDDIHKYLLAHALGEDVEIPRRQREWHAGAMMLPVPCEGRFMAIRGVGDAQRVPGIQDVIVNTTRGEIFVTYPEQSCYKGFLTARCATFEEVEASLSRAAELIEFGLTPIECETWRRSIGSDASYRAPAEQGIRSLDGLPVADAEAIILPLIASTHFGELPDSLATKDAGGCLRCLERTAQPDTDLWLVSERQGVALGTIRDGRVGSISMLGLSPESRRNGLGEGLVRTLAAAFARHGCSEMETVVDPRRPASAALYKKLGFEPVKQEACMCCEA